MAVGLSIVNLLKFQYFIENLRLKGSLQYVFITITTFLVAKSIFSIDVNTYAALKTIVIMALYCFYSETINNFFDRFNDRINPTKLKVNPLASKKLSSEEGLVFSFVLLVLGALLTFIWFGYLVFFYLLLTLNSTLYSTKFKSTPMLNLMSHGIGVIGLFIFPAIIINLNSIWILFFSIVLLLFSNSAQIENQILDFNYDKKAMLNTLPVVYGIKFTKFLYYFSNISIIIFSTLLFFHLQNFYIVFITLLGTFQLFKLNTKLISQNWDKILIMLLAFFLLALFDLKLAF